MTDEGTLCPIFDDDTTVNSLFPMIFGEELSLRLEELCQDQTMDDGLLSNSPLDSSLYSVGPSSTALSPYGGKQQQLTPFTSSSPLVIDAQNFKMISIQTGENVDVNVSNPITNVIPCHLIEQQNKDTWLLVPTGTSGATNPSTQSYIAVPVPGGFQGLSMPSLPFENPAIMSADTTEVAGPSSAHETGRVDNSAEPSVMMSNLATVDDMQALEDYVKRDQRNAARLAKVFQGQGGTGSKNHMHRALGNLMRTELAGTYTWAGMIRNGERKHSFKKLAVANILIDTILSMYYKKKSVKKQSSERLTLENVIKEWLKRQGVSARAPKRAGK